MQTSMIRLIKPADIISMLNVGFGFLAVIILLINLIELSFALHLSFSFILLALLADGLDGIVARKTEKGILGEYFEAMADMTSMGIAPSLFVLFIYKDLIIDISYVYLIGFIFLLLFFLFCCCIRLAAFHPLKSKTYFTGLPASAATIIIITSSYMEMPFYVIALLVALLAIGMISNIPYPKLDMNVNIIATIFIFATIFFGKTYSNIMPILLFILIALYILISPFFIKKTKLVSEKSL